MTDRQTKMLKLHNQAAQGHKLKKAERVLLDAWYEEQDQLEYDAIIGEPKNFAKPPLQKLLDQLALATDQLQIVLLENEELKKQNAQLRHTIAKQLQPA